MIDRRGVVFLGGEFFNYLGVFGNCNGTFTPLIYSVTGGAGPEAQLFHKHLALQISTKPGERYEKVLSLLRWQLSFLILRLVLICVRGSRNSRANNSTTVEDFDVACHNARIDQ